MSPEAVENSPTRPLTPPYPRAHLLSLPSELLTLITSQLDIPTALSFAQTCRHLLKPAEQRIWRKVDLSVSKHHGEFPLIRPYGFHDHQYCPWAQKEARAAEERRRVATSDRINVIVLVGNRERFNHIKELVIDPAPGSIVGILQVLNMVRGTIESLKFTDKERHPFDQQWETPSEERFWHLLKRPGLTDYSFLNLTQLDITLSHFDNQHSYTGLILLAPSLKRLRLDLRAATQCGNDEDCMCNGIDMPIAPYLTHLDIRYRQLQSASMPADIANLLCNAINLTSLKIDSRHVNGFRYEAADLDEVLTNFEFNGRLQHLEWLVEPSESFQEMVEVICDVGETLRTVQHGAFIGKITSIAGERIEFVPILPTMAIESLVVVTEVSSKHYNHIAVGENNPSSAVSAQVTGIPPDIMQGILKPQKDLRSIQFASSDGDLRELVPFQQWQEKNIRGILIRSFTHANGEELHHTRTLTYSHRQSVSSKNSPVPEKPCITSRSKNQAWYYQSDGKEGRIKTTYTVGNELHWEDATDYQGEIVPLDIIRQMEVAGGVEADQWERGIQMGEEAWKILKDWKEAVDKAKAEAKQKETESAAVEGSGAVPPAAVAEGEAVEGVDDEDGSSDGSDEGGNEDTDAEE